MTAGGSMREIALDDPVWGWRESDVGRTEFAADDSYRSRDYRFLGSIGRYDTAFLPLAAGDDDPAIAVSEDFGGWGVQARFDESDGLVFED